MIDAQRVDGFNEVQSSQEQNLSFSSRSVCASTNSEPQSQNEGSRLQEEQQILPVAMCVPEIVINDTSLVTDGTVVTPTRFKMITKKATALLLALCTIIFLVSMIPSLHQMRAQTKLWKILKTVSSEGALKDKNSAQNYVWKFQSKILFDLDNFDELLNDRDHIIMHYVGLLIPLCTRSVVEWKTSSSHDHICDAMMCNEDNQITVMVLRHNYQGGGIICHEIGLLEELTDFILSRNDLKGSIPTEIGLLKDLRNLDLRDNFLTGTIPTEIGQLEQLEWVFLDNNHLTGTVPTEIGNLKNLKFGNFSRNSLSGSLPSEVNNLTHLGGLNLEHTNITGPLNSFCFLNFTNEPFVLEKDVSINHLHYKYSYTGHFGLYTDCKNGNPIIECDCCICV